MNMKKAQENIMNPKLATLILVLLFLLLLIYIAVVKIIKPGL